MDLSIKKSKERKGLKGLYFQKTPIEARGEAYLTKQQARLDIVADNNYDYLSRERFVM